MDRARLKVFGLSYKSMSHTGAYALILAEEHDAFRVPIIIGIAEAQSIAIQLENLHSQRPLTHDLIKSLTDRLGATLEEVFIYYWEAGIFYSELRFRHGEELLKIDSRTSDAIALALRYDCPIYIAAKVIEQTAIPVADTEVIKEHLEKVQAQIEKAKEAELTEEDLKRLLAEAVKNEDYESASRYRDMLNARKSE
ncbi:bifunctional nuclease family protein [Butyricimonas synergistica]|mgnify:CR=1 FL=1|uniref:bifunctional nuclease family protein n=1 Tax=Butyricimonas synergistica TaxID=544644 RepID=UPI00047639C3|nr:bifunctional nuclease family protein [Butyricimonas synergistica]